MDLFPKFIIEDGNLIIGKVKQHRHLCTDDTKVRGGGWYLFENNTFVFSGESMDFGPAKIEDIRKAVEEGKVFDTVLTRNISDRFSFEYDNHGEIIKLK